MTADPSLSLYSGFAQSKALCPATELSVVVNQWWHYGRLTIGVYPIAQRQQDTPAVTLWEGRLQQPLAERPTGVLWMLAPALTEEFVEAKKFWATGDVTGNCMLDVEQSDTTMKLTVQRISGDSQVFSTFELELFYSPGDHSTADFVQMSGLVTPAHGIEAHTPWTILSLPPTGPELPKRVSLEQ